MVAVDGSDEAKQAARRGLKFAHVFGATVDVVRVVEQKSLRLTRTGDEDARLRERGEAILSEIEATASDLDLSLTATVTWGKPAVRFTEHAAEENAALVVVGRRGMTGLGTRLLGSVTEQILSRSDVPVLVVPQNASATDGNDCPRLLVPTDGSENAERAAEHGVTVARRYDSTVHVLNVVDLQAAGGVFDAGGLERAFVDRLEASGEEAVDAIAAEIGEAAPHLAVKTGVVRSPSFAGVASGIREYVIDHDIDLLVVGSHGRSNFERQLLGSVTSVLLRTVDVPVLVVTRSSNSP